MSEHWGAGCSPKQETEAAEDTVARETWDVSLRDRGQRGLTGEGTEPHSRGWHSGEKESV